MEFSKIALGAALVTVLNGAIEAKTLTIGSDLSQSNPLLQDANFNQQAVSYVVAQIRALKRGDVVVLKTFGGLADSQNFKSKSFTIKRHNAKKIAKYAAHHITKLASLSEAQKSTNLVAWLQRGRFDCANDSQIILLTDGIEASEYVSPSALLLGKANLPNPNKRHQLKGCEVVFFGLGVGRPDKQNNILLDEWHGYFEKAGVPFEAIQP